MALEHEPLLLSILSQPTAPFREQQVITTLCREFDSSNVPYFFDSAGNMVLGVSSQKEYQTLLRKNSPEPLRIFMAHLDHPGFHGIRWKSKQDLAVQWHGGSPTQHLVGAPVWLATSKGWAGQGELIEIKLTSSERGIDTAVVRVPEDFSSHYSRGPEIYGGFHFRSPVWKEGDLIYTKAADDLVGAFAIASLALRTWKKNKLKKQPPFLGLLTRAEEVGFIGAIAHFDLGLLQKSRRKILCISLETSRALPNAEIGKGPVVRLGDRTTVFDPAALHLLSQIAQKVLPEKHQRRIMDGGSCEATPATAYGFPAIGISIPLGNYHNQSIEGGPDSRGPMGPAPEFVHSEDIDGLIKLCHALSLPGHPWSDPWKEKKKNFKTELNKYRKLLK